MSSDPGLLVVIAGPSGAGKTTMARRLVEDDCGFEFSVSVTTRRPRAGERDGRDYIFVSDQEFDSRVSSGFFLEWAEVHGSRYGTSREQVESVLSRGGSIVLDVDVQGALSVRRSMPRAVLVFILPPSSAALESRLSGRGTEAPGDLAARIAAAAGEVRWAGAFDYLLVNDGVEDTVAAVRSIVGAERARPREMEWPACARALEGDLLTGSDYWAGRRILVASGPSREYLDDVRFISNRSSGVMGCELAAAFRSAGAEVLLLCGPGSAMPPSGVGIRGFSDSLELGRLIEENLEGCGLLAMPAAVSDFRPRERVRGKIPRTASGMTLDLEQVEDLSARFSALVPLLSFSLEYGDGALERAVSKMRRKGAEAVFCNRGDIDGCGMDAAGNAGVLVHRSGASREVPRGSKRFVAEAVVALLGRYMGA